MAGSGEVLTRRMEVADLEQVHAIDTLAFSLPWPERSFLFELTRNPAARCWVAEVDDIERGRRVAGMLVTWMIVDEAHIATLATHPEYRRMGIGRRLLAVGLLQAADEGAQRSMLEVRRGNLPARSLYERFGYQVVSVRPQYYKDNNEDALLMNLAPLERELILQQMD